MSTRVFCSNWKMVSCETLVLCDLQETTALMLAASEADCVFHFNLCCRICVLIPYIPSCQGHPDVLKARLSEGFLSTSHKFSESTMCLSEKLAPDFDAFCVPRSSCVLSRQSLDKSTEFLVREFHHSLLQQLQVRVAGEYRR